MRSFVLALCAVMAAGAQTAAEDYEIYNDHPRLLLTRQRLRLLKRERERQSPRWIQFETLIQGKAAMPEAAFALALYHAVAGDEAAGRRAIERALDPATDARQAAFVFDWCNALLSGPQRAALEARLKPAARIAPRDIPGARTAALVAVALGDGAALKTVVAWWRERAAAELRSGKRTLDASTLLPALELWHAVRDNIQAELRDDILPVYRNLALARLLSYYPATYPAAENEFRIPWFSGKGEPDLRNAALARIGEMSLVAYDNNAQEMQFLQGWLMHDRFVLRSPFGAPYEFLWANPYQPGLPFEKMPLFYHDSVAGSVVARSDWEEAAVWAYVSASTAQVFRGGRLETLPPGNRVVLGETAILRAQSALTAFRVAKDGPVRWFVTGLKPAARYDIEIDDEDMTEAVTDPGGILSLEFTRQDNQAVHIRESRPS